jgi:hypothetical protein
VLGHDPGRYEGFEGKVRRIYTGLCPIPPDFPGFKCRFIRISCLKNLILRDSSDLTVTLRIQLLFKATGKFQVEREWLGCVGKRFAVFKVTKDIPWDFVV